jgi:hypothetical protein
LYFWEKETSKKRLEQCVLHILDYNNIHAKVDHQLPKQFCLDCCSTVNQTERFLQVEIDCRHSVRDKFWPADMHRFPHVTWSSCYFLPTVKICQKKFTTLFFFLICSNIVRFPCLYEQGLQALLCMRIKCHQHALFRLEKSML